MSIYKEEIREVLKEELKNRFSPTKLASKFNTLVSADTDIISDIKTTKDLIVRITVCVDPGAVLRIKITRAGVSKLMDLNAGTALTARALYAFDVPSVAGTTINLQTSVGTTVNILDIHEIVAVGP